MKSRKVNILGYLKVILILIVILGLSGNPLLAQTCSVNPGVDSTICSNNRLFLNGSHTGSSADKVFWTQIAGPEVTFVDSTDLKTEIIDFIPDTSYIFRLSAECSDDTLVYEEVVINVVSISEAVAGSDTAYCAGVHELNASPPLFINEIGEWSGSVPGITVDEINNPNSTITILPTSSGFITLSWTITDTLTGCSSSDDLIVNINSREILVTAGPDETVCLNDSLILSGAAIDTSYDSLFWSTDGTGTFSDPATLNPTYYPSSADSINGNVTLTLTVFGITACSDSIASMVLSIAGEPTVTAGPDYVICSSLGKFVPEANASDFSSILWKTNGTGTFDDDTDLNATYFPGAIDIAAGWIELSLTAFGHGSCEPVSDTMVLTLQNGPGVYAGNDAKICTGGFYQILDAEIYSFKAFFWTHDGTGVLQNANKISPTYIAGDGETGIVNIVLSATQPDTNLCVVPADTMQIMVSDNPVIVCPAQDTFWFENITGKDHYKITDNSLDATGMVDCGDVVVSHDYNSWGNSGSLMGASFPVGITQVTWTVTDLSGNSDTCNITVVVKDKEAPKFINCPAGNTLTLSIFPGTCETGAVWNIPIAEDNASDVTVVQSFGPELGTLIEEGNYIIEYQATDTSGNYSYCNFVIEVVNLQQPKIICQSDLQQESDFGKCSWTSGPNSLSPLYVNNNCNLDIWWDVTNPDGSVVSGTNDVSGYTFLPGVSKVTYSIVKDDTIQVSECSFEVNVVQQSPEIYCQSDTIIEALPGECKAEVELFPPTVIDSCLSTMAKIEYRVFNPDNSVSELISGTNLFYEFHAGVSRVEWHVFNNENISSVCFQNITVNVIEESLVPDAGPNSIICELDSFYISGATAPGIESVRWTTSGTGTFTDPGVLNSIYIPSQLDIDNGYAILTLSSISGCTAASDQMVLNIEKSFEISAGNDVAICDFENYQLLGTISKSSVTVEWKTTGTGTFSNPNILNPVYYPGTTDIETGNVKLVISALGAQGCGNSTDTMNLFIDRHTDIEAGEDGWVCNGFGYYLEDASVSNEEDIIWTTSGTGTFDDATAVNARYFPSPTDVYDGKVVLTISHNGAGSCGVASDNLTIRISKRPEGDAGDDLNICANQPVTVNNAYANNYSSVFWTHSGSGILQNSNTLSPTYIPAENEQGTVTLSLFIVGIESCIADTIIHTTQILLSEGMSVKAMGDSTVFSNTRAKLSVHVENGSGFYLFNWQPATEVTDPSSKNTETILLGENTTFTVTVTDAQTGCILSDELSVFVEENPDKIINIYNAISPNGDGINDSWQIDGIEKFPENEVVIYNRWGDKIKEFRNYNNETIVWNGTDKRNDKLVDGTYYYVVKLSEIKSYTGWVQIRSY